MRPSCPILVSALAAAAVLLGSCREKSSGPAEAPGRPDLETNSDPAPTAITASEPAPLPGFDPHQLRADPGLAGWQSESFSDAATSQLKRLAAALIDRDESGTADLSSLLASGFTTSPLQPTSLLTVFEDSGLRISRLAPGVPPAPPQHQSDLAGELVRLLPGLDPTSRLQAEFKIVSVDLAAGSPVTDVLVHLAWTGATRRHQLNTSWRCEWESAPDQVPLLKRLDSQPDDFELVTLDAPDPLLADRTAAVLAANPSFRDQLRHGSDYWMQWIEGAYGIDLMDPQGIAVADVNGDGLDDLYLCQPGGLPNRLFLAQPDGTALDHSAAAGLDFCDFCRHALFVDLDNDGDQDLAALLATTAIFYENDGRAVFRERTRWAIPGNPYSFTAADYDHDRFLDLYLVVRDADPSGRRNSLLGDPVPYHDANNGGANVMLHNEGGFLFRPTTAEIGLDANNRRFSQAAAWEDYDNDGDLDLYVANDFGRNNLYRNDGGSFTDVAPQAGVEDLSAGMSASWADYNRDGRMDLYVGNMFSSAGNRITYQRKFKTGAGDETVAGFRRHARGNSLFENLGDETFRDVSVESGVTMGRWAWASPFVDLNNDTWADLAVANGFITNSDSGDL